VIREAKLVGFFILMAAVFLCAHAVGSHLGPVSTTHSHVSYPGMGGGGMGGMNMGQPASQGPAPAARLRGAR
jgi:hypothetical protein